MRTTSDCLPCFLRQALGTARRSTTDPARHWQLVGEVGGLLATFDPQLSPPENALQFYRLIAARTGTTDPFAAEKAESNRFAQGLEPRTRELIRSTSDPLRTAIQFAISANVLDYGAQHLLDRDEALAACRRPLTIDHSAALCARLEPGADILYLADNCGEIVFDRLVVEQLLARGCRVTVAVRSQPIINDATRVDAVACGLDQLCEVIDSGSDAPGTPLALCSPAFRARFASADCVIAKGMGNFESLSDTPDPLRTAIQFAISANVLDYGAQHLLDRDEALAACRRPLTIDHSLALCPRLVPGADILYLADNCGEIVFDRLVVEQLLARGCRVTVAVRSRPIINDATREDAVACGLDRLCEVIDSGSDAPGTPLALCSPDFRARFAAADCIIAKGMGNFESLSDAPAPLFFLFVVKCATVLAHLRARFPEAGLRIGSPVLLRGEAAA